MPPITSATRGDFGHITLSAFAILVLLYIGPFAAVRIEILVLGSTHVAKLLRRIGVHDFYESIYLPLGPLLQKIDQTLWSLI